ncbi:HAMP domain-containing histidine kinase [Fulvivirga sp. RKSG066]|uniref:sensor histidine kinase n=1 Tax=Fulvivirga aurantia TaxID=2529383 RepID=UPI0012BCD4EB|nr:HAMP domain-containing sensor histidine kinase [Fulvivirga aurantia]MTI23113.1 HAMP domain-containing histidine kinase [Fulvivirga aurantia]
MTRTTIRVLIIMAILSIVGITITQVYWFRRAFNTEQQQFNRDVNVALFNVANQFFKINKAAIPANNPIKQLSTNYYVVMINNEIDANLLEFLLTAEFEKRNIEADFEYGIYDCTSDKMVYGSYVSMDEAKPKNDDASLPKWENQNYYFGVQFPNEVSIITDRMEVWVFSSTVLLVVIIFFASALFVILKQRRLSEVQKDFINNMTHEFKTPISTIALSAEVLKDPATASDVSRMTSYANIIETENQRMKKQVERVLQMASVDNDEVVLCEDLLDAHQLITEVVKDLNMRLEEHEAEVTLQLNATNTTIKADQLHLRNVLHNLIDNAIKYTKGQPLVTISTRNATNTICIGISDNGIGIPTDQQKKIFEKFYRVPTGNVHNVKGFGLGLNYVQHIVKAHHGKIDLDSKINKGSIFKITLKNA